MLYRFNKKMLTEKHVLLSLVEMFIDDGCVKNEQRHLFKSYLKKDEFNCFNIIDKDYSIKCVFDKEFLKIFFSHLPSYVKFDSFDNSMVLIKKSYFDVLFTKNLNKTVSVRIVLYIEDFEVDFSIKARAEYKMINVNSHVRILEKLKEFYYKFTNIELKNNFHPDYLEAKNFINKQFPMNYNSDSKNRSYYKILKHGYDNYLMNTGICLENKNNYIYEAYSFENDEQEVVKEKNTLLTNENINKINFKKLFVKEPNEINIENILVGKKTERDEIKGKYLEM